MDAELVLQKLTTAFEAQKFKVYADDSEIREQVPFPGPAIADIVHGQVELYLPNGFLTEEVGLNRRSAAEVAAAAIVEAGLRGLPPQGGDAEQSLLNGRVIITAL